MGRTKNKPTKRSTQGRLRKPAEAQKLPFIAHFRELRKRLFYIALSVGVFAGVAYSIEKQLTAWLLKPAGAQQFIYTTPGGGFDFLFKLCLYSGIAASIPIIMYHLFRYIHPLLGQQSRRFMLGCTLWSSSLALLGIAFGYFFGLPAAMHFLLQSFSSDKISALITIQSYISFVMVYLLGAALLFQIPLILILINRIKPLSPRKLMKYQRWVIVGAFVIGAVISPTPDIRNQVILSGPAILMYELSIAIIWALNRRGRKSKKVLQLLQKDAELQADRLTKFAEARAVLHHQHLLRSSAHGVQTSLITPIVGKPTAAKPMTQRVPRPIAAASVVPPPRPQRYLREFTRPSYNLPRQAPQL